MKIFWNFPDFYDFHFSWLFPDLWEPWVKYKTEYIALKEH